MVDRDMLARVLPFAAYLSFFLIADLLSYLGVSAEQLRSLYALKILVVVALLWRYRNCYSDLAWQPMRWQAWTLALLAGVLVLVLWVNLDARWMHLGSSVGYDPNTNGRLDWMLVAVRLAGAALVVPVMEELFWRSYLMRWIKSVKFLQVDPARVGLRALAVSVGLFGVEHSLWLAGMVAGLVYALLYMRSRNLWMSIVAHGVTNGLLGGWIIFTGNWTYW